MRENASLAQISPKLALSLEGHSLLEIPPSLTELEYNSIFFTQIPTSL